jgi:Na+/proline symporter
VAHFTSLDWFWTGSFVLPMVGGAFFFYRLARRSESDFFLAGRCLPWWALLLAVAVGATVLLHRHFAGREE